MYRIVPGGVCFGLALIRVDGDGEVGGNELPCESWVRTTYQQTANKHVIELCISFHEIDCSSLSYFM